MAKLSKTAHKAGGGSSAFVGGGAMKRGLALPVAIAVFAMGASLWAGSATWNFHLELLRRTRRSGPTPTTGRAENRRPASRRLRLSQLASGRQVGRRCLGQWQLFAIKANSCHFCPA